MNPPVIRSGVTREQLLDGQWLEGLRASAPPGTHIRSDAELQASLDETLAGIAPDEDVHVFGYGSLMWNPAFEYAESQPATLTGWCRRFCLLLYMGRGSPLEPGVMLALDRGGACRGLVFRIPAAAARLELLLLWRREMLTGSYHARWVRVRVGDRQVRALTFVVNRRHERYTGPMDAEALSELICKGRGRLGTAAEYFQGVLATLRQLGVTDAGLRRLEGCVSRRLLQPHRGGAGHELGAPRVGTAAGAPVQSAVAVERTS